MNPLIRADMFVLERLAQPVVNWLGRTWGIELAQIVVCLTALVFVSHLAWGADILTKKTSLIGGTLAATGVIAGVFWCSVIVIGARAAEAQINTNVFRFFFVRMFMWASIIFQWALGADWLLVAGVLEQVALYVISCNRPPPRRSRQLFKEAVYER